jgi:rare lipoprotein A
VTNTANGKTVDVKINDRGPFVKGRIIDLSRKSFEQIGDISKGIAPVKIEIIDDSNTFRYKH